MNVRPARVRSTADRRVAGDRRGAIDRRVAPDRKGIGFIEMVRRANIPPAPEHSITFRIATAIAVLTGILACAAVGELSLFTAVLACAGTLVGMVFSYVTHNKPWQWVKLLLAVAVLGVFASFVLQIVGAAHAGQLSSIEVPLAGLFTWVQVIHAFDVPARRDLLFSLAAAGALLTVAAAQAVSVDFLGYVAVWLGACLVGLGCSWRSMTGGVGPLALGSIAITGIVVVLLGAGFLIFLPAPRAAQSITLPSSLTSYLPLANPGGITGSGSQATEPAQAGRSSGRTGVGGYLGFASQLDTATRGALGNQVVMRVRADRPGYFLGMTFDTWTGQNWERSRGHQQNHDAALRFTLRRQYGVQPARPTQPGGRRPAEPARPGLARFRLPAGQRPDVLRRPAPGEPVVRDIGADGGLLSRAFADRRSRRLHAVHDRHDARDGVHGHLGRQRGAAERVGEDPAQKEDRSRSSSSRISTSRARTSGSRLSPTRSSRRPELRRPMRKVTALEAWMSRHVKYSTDIPPLLPGQDAVDQFLFGSRVGYCEQISTSLAVMLRTLGVPAREAIGYVPGPFDPLSDLYEIQAKDAHAWVQVWFPTAGWQNFDPTAQVPLAPPDPGAVLLSDVGHAIAGLPWVPLGAFLGGVRGGRDRDPRAAPAPTAANGVDRTGHRGARTTGRGRRREAAAGRDARRIRRATDDLRPLAGRARPRPGRSQRPPACSKGPPTAATNRTSEHASSSRRPCTGCGRLVVLGGPAGRRQLTTA